MNRYCRLLLSCLIMSALCTPRRGGLVNSVLQNGTDFCLLQVTQGLGFEPLPVGHPDNDLLTNQNEVQPPEPLYGFRIGTSAGLANVVNDGLVVATVGEGRASHAKVISDQAASWFYSSYDAVTADAPPRIDIVDVTAASSDESVVTVTVLRPIRRPGGRRSFSLIAGGASSVSQFAYVCHGAGEAIVRIEILFRDPRRLAPAILLRKVCKDLPVPGLALGTAFSRSSVVEDGSSKWTRMKSPLIAFENTELPLSLSRTPPNLGNQSFEAPRVRVVTQSLGLEDANVTDPNLHVGSKVATGLTILEVSLDSSWVRTGGRSSDLVSGHAEDITVKFRCLYPGIALVELLLIPSPAWQPYKPQSVFMRKVCGGIHKRGLHVGSYKGASDLVRDGIVQGTLPKVGLLARSSHFFIQYPSFEDGDPQLEPSPRVRCVAGGEERIGVPSPVDAILSVASGTRKQQLTITYTCKRGATAVCQLDVGLHFWKPVVLHWSKSCEGSRPDAVIESDLESFSDVFSVGHAAPAWAKTEPAVELPAEQSTASFIIRSNNSGKPEDPEPLTLGRPIIEVSDPKVLNVMLLSNAALHGRVVKDSADFVAVTAQHMCKSAGQAVVHVKVPFLHYLPNSTSLLSADSDLMSQFDAAEFAYKKHCMPRQHYVAYAMAFGGAVLFILGFVGTTGFALGKYRQLNHSPSDRMILVYGAADSQQQQQQQQQSIGDELGNAADHE